MNVLPPDAETLVTLSGVSKTYTGSGHPRTVLANVDMDIDRGEWVALLGRSGSGKSTLLNLIGALDVPTSGAVCVNGRDITALAEHERAHYRRADVGFVFQFFNLIATLSVAENLALVLELNGCAPQAVRPRIDAALGGLGLLDVADRFPDRLSGGEQQRVAIARAIVHRPLLVLADEPTGNLDTDSERDILHIFRHLPERHGVTVITATHSTEVAAGADRVLELSDGRIEVSRT